jgi:hypothetical protein
MENEKIKVKIEIDFTYNATALETIKKVVEEYNRKEESNLSIEEFLDMQVEDMLYERLECDYDCIDGEEYEVNWTIEKS